MGLFDNIKIIPDDLKRLSTTIKPPAKPLRFTPEGAKGETPISVGIKDASKLASEVTKGAAAALSPLNPFSDIPWVPILIGGGVLLALAIGGGIALR